MSAEYMASLLLAAFILVAGADMTQKQRRQHTETTQENEKCSKEIPDINAAVDDRTTLVFVDRGGVWCENVTKGFEYCNSQLNWRTLSLCPKVKTCPKVGERSNPGKSCQDVLIERRKQEVTVKSRAYWITLGDSAYPVQMYCDMKTAGGGWTLVAKVRGSSKLMTGLNSAQWRDGKAIGNSSNLDSEDALGLAYSSLPFQEVMIRSLADSCKYVAWNHTEEYPSIKYIVNEERKRDSLLKGEVFRGNIDQLDYVRRPGDRKHPRCEGLMYGFRIQENETSKKKAAANEELTARRKNRKCNYNTTAIINIGAFSETNPRKQTCITDFGIGGGSKYAITACYKETEICLKSHAIFIRQKQDVNDEHDSGYKSADNC